MLRNSTILNSLDRHRFVTETMAQPYLEQRERANLLVRKRKIEAKIETLMKASKYGTLNAMQRADGLMAAVAHLHAVTCELALHPTPGEAQTQSFGTAD